ncbi:MarR family winged helix-turn-helix transcriptional regulator [Rugamonas sp.]|uniref:MarR family winged helix-turn-helix transcriptional regulator n=1 Tax=Rugamonas sp. TaxID=1926287 RepID=UPI0025CC6086|nr:MarR family winged helix-turn-helix transcriptional regulator [Rugamonas sp.]
MTFPCYNTALRTAARVVTAAYDDALAPMGIGSAQYTLLKMLAGPEPMALTELGAKMRLDRSTVGRNVRVLEKNSLLTLGTGADARETTVALSAAGRAMLKAATPLWDKAQRAFEARIGKDAAHGLRDLLQTLE